MRHSLFSVISEHSCFWFILYFDALFVDDHIFCIIIIIIKSFDLFTILHVQYFLPHLQKGIFDNIFNLLNLECILIDFIYIFIHQQNH